MNYSDDVAHAFSEWEQRLRGWDVYPFTVELEPPLVPLAGYLTPSTPTVDDGRHDTVLSSLAGGIASVFKPQAASDLRSETEDPEFDDIPDIFTIPDEEFCTFQVALPTDHTGSLTTYKNLLQVLRYAGNHLSFEIIGTTERIAVQFCAWKNDSEKLLAQIRAQLPSATVIESIDALVTSNYAQQVLVVDFGLEHEVMRPLSCISDLKHDPLTALIGGMEDLGVDEQCVFQILFKHTNEPWGVHLQNSVVNSEGKPLFDGAPELVSQAKEKTSSPLYSCVIRIASIAASEHRCWQIAKSIGGALSQYDAPTTNNLMPLNNEDYDANDHWHDVVGRTSHRSGMLLSLNELIGLLHYPDAVVKSKKLDRQRIKTKAAPDLALGNELIIGVNEHRGVKQEVSLNPEQRSRHMYIVGASGTGKSTLMLNCIRQDIESGQGVCVLDPHGDLIDQTLAFIPESRIDDVILLDPSDEQYPIGLNILHAHSDLEKTLLASDLTAVFERLSTTWGDQMNAVLANGILAFLESEVGGTLVDLRRFLIEKDFRNEFLETVSDPEIVYYWKHEFPLLSGRPQASVLTRLNTFLRPKPIRRMVAQKKSAIDFADVMDNGKILLAKLSHGGIGEENAYLLGAIIASKLHQTALARQAVTQEKRRFFWLYIDEFQNFITPSIAQTLSGARKYHLGMILGHQELTQVSIQDRAIAASVIANPYTRICFRMGDKDAKTLSEGFSEFDSKDLQSLGIGEAIGRIEQANYDFLLLTNPLPEIDSDVARERQETIRKASREKYATPLEEPNGDAEKKTSGDSTRRKKSTQFENISETCSEGIPGSQQKGKGGDLHKEMQLQLQKVAHDSGFGATIEHHIGYGQHIDVVINTGIQEIACEISISTSVEHEVGNIRKCLDAGFQHIWVIAESDTHLMKIKYQANKQFDSKTLREISYLKQENLMQIIQSLKGQKIDKASRGYQVERNWNYLDEDGKKRREELFAKIV